MNTNKLTLSKSILEMKFMKRTKEKVEKQQFEDEGMKYFGSEITTQMQKKSERFLMEPSFALCQGLIDGRLSFQGMNPTIEKLMELVDNEKRAQLEKKQETDVSDEQMAVQWQKIRAKFQGTHKRKRRKSQEGANDQDQDVSLQKKPMFLKPVD